MSAAVAATSAERILVVDDEDAVVQSLCDTLNRGGLAAEGVSDPRAALTRLRSGGIDLLVTDLVMPAMDGISLLRSALEIDPTVAAVVITGHGTVSSAIEAMQSGALDYIQKPFSVGLILAVVQRALALRQLRIDDIRSTRAMRQRALDLELGIRDLDAFTRIASHDLQGPLAVIKGLAQVVEEGFASQVPAEAAMLLRRIVATSDRMRKLIDDLMRMSRVGRQKLERQPVDVAALAREVFEEVLQHDPDRVVELRVDAVPTAEADPPLLRQALVNLIANAVKFTRQQSIGLVRLSSELREGERIYSLQDNGIGFDEKHASRLFEPFQRLHADFEGNGIGLSIVRRIVEHHQGRIWAEPVPGGGATFRFTLAPTGMPGRPARMAQ